MKVQPPLPSRLLDEARHGIVDTRALAAAGLSPAMVQARERLGSIQRISRGVFLIPGCADEWTPIAAAQRRWPTLVLAGRSAMVLHGCDGADHPPQAADLRKTERGCRAPYPMMKSLSLTDATDISGICVLRPLSLLARAPYELGDDRIEAALETFLRRRTIDEAEIRAVCEGCGAGLTHQQRTRLARLMSTRGWGLPPTESYLETLTVQRVLRPAGLAHTRQVVISLGGSYLKRFDFQLESGLLLNCHGMAFHTSRAAVQQDAAYGLRLRMAGLEVETVTWDDVTRRPRKTAHDLAIRTAQVAEATALAQSEPVRRQSEPVRRQSGSVRRQN